MVGKAFPFPLYGLSSFQMGIYSGFSAEMCRGGREIGNTRNVVVTKMLALDRGKSTLKVVNLSTLTKNESQGILLKI